MPIRSMAALSPGIPNLAVTAALAGISPSWISRAFFRPPWSKLWVSSDKWCGATQARAITPPTAPTDKAGSKKRNKDGVIRNNE
ncbi:hypothetical protein ES703_69709 [subsurface metagenome]